MSFLKDIKTFSRDGLRHTETEVTYVDGRRIKEVRDPSGSTSSELIDVGLGFVGDYKPDLQVALVMPHVYLGSQDVAADLGLLQGHSITHIVNAAAQLPNSYPAFFTYCNLNILDLPETNILDYFPEAFKFMDEARESGNVFVHCNAGVSRAASVVIGYLMRTEGLGFQEAYDKVKNVRASIRPNDGFRQQLRNYHPAHGPEKDSSVQ